MQDKEPSPGIYRHYKNRDYRVIGCAMHTETEEELVVYEALYDNRLWVRPRQMFLENLDIDGKSVPRFRLISEE